MIYFLSFLLFLLLLTIFVLNGNDIIAPAILFTFAFFMSSLVAAIYSNKWLLNLHINTFIVILFGTLEFAICCLLVRKLFNIFVGDKLIAQTWTPGLINIKRYKLDIFIVLEIFSIMYSIYSVVHLMGGSLSNFTNSIALYRNQSMFSDNPLGLPASVTYSKSIVNAAGYWFGYILVNNYASIKKFDIRLLIIVLLSAISNYSLGGRNGLIYIIFAIVSSFYIIKNKTKKFKKSINWLSFLKLAILSIIILSSFESLAFLIGRSGFVDGTSGMDYLAVYIGAPIKNLDTFLQEYVADQLFQNQTFNNLINWLAPKFNSSISVYALYLPFRSVNGMTLGNVYTTFYSFILDYGYFGMSILVAVMAIISQFVYEIVKRSRKHSIPAISSLIYSFISGLLLLSFFSNKFYEQLFSRGFIQIIICWYIFQIVFISSFKDKRENLNRKL